MLHPSGLQLAAVLGPGDLPPRYVYRLGEPNCDRQLNGQPSLALPGLCPAGVDILLGPPGALNKQVRVRARARVGRGREGGGRMACRSGGIG